MERTFDRGYLLASGTWYQDFINPDRFVFQVPTRVEGRTTHRLLDDRVMVHFAGEGANFQRDRGYDGQRLDLRPEVEVPWRAGRYAYGSFRGGFRETLYHLDESRVPEQVNTNPADPGSQPPSILPALDETANRELFYLRGDVATSMARVYPFERFGFTRLKHTIEPTLGYLFVPRTNERQAALPLFDDVDRINQRSVVTYGVTSRLLARLEHDVGSDRSDRRREPAAGRTADAGGRELPSLDAERTDNPIAGGLEAPPQAPASGVTREVARFSLFQSYDFANKSGDFIDDVDPVTNEVLRAKGSRISDLSAYLRLTPSKYLSFEGRTDYSVTGEGAKGVTVGVFLSDPTTRVDDFGLASLRGRTRVGLGYRFVANQAVEEVNGSMLVRFMKQLYGAYEARYDNRSGRFLEHRYGLRLVSNQECWVVDLGIADRVNPDETEVRLLVSLVGLAQFGKEPFRQSLGAIAAPVQGFMQ